MNISQDDVLSAIKELRLLKKDIDKDINKSYERNKKIRKILSILEDKSGKDQKSITDYK